MLLPFFANSAIIIVFLEIIASVFSDDYSCRLMRIIDEANVTFLT